MAEVARFARDALGGEIFVVERGGQPVGASACAHFGASGWVGAVAVLPEQRRGGLGGALTRAAIERLRQLGAGTVMLGLMPLSGPRLRSRASSGCGDTRSARPCAAAP